MVTILMIPAKIAILGLLKLKVFELKAMTSEFLPMASPTNFYQMVQIVL